MTWDSAQQARFLDAPDGVEYLERVRQHFPGDSVELAILLCQIRSWIKTERWSSFVTLELLTESF